MINVIKSEERHHQDMGWLDARWHFSFSDYYDANNMSWGPLRVFNDDVIRGGGGFGAHPHRDMEIITYVIDGALEHSDSMGHKEALRAGEVQVMSAGKGVVHAEYNHAKDKDLRLTQLWILPRNKGTKPRWEQKGWDPALRHNQLLAVVSDGSTPGTLAIDQDASIYVSTLDAGKEVVHETKPGRKAYAFVIDGDLEINGTALSAGDQGRIADESRLTIRGGSSKAELLLLDLPA